MLGYFRRVGDAAGTGKDDPDLPSGTRVATN
jgi:hypothetical protein